MIEFPKYPRTLHLEGSKGTVDKDAIPFSNLRGEYLVVEEKMDGSMVGIGFDSSADVHVFHRNKEAVGEEFDNLKSWISDIEDMLFDVLEDRYGLYREWMFPCHTIFYDNVPSYFIEYDIYDRQEKIWLSTKIRRTMLFGLPIISANVDRKSVV